MKENLILAAVAANNTTLLNVLHDKLDLLSFDALVYLHDLGHPSCDRLTMDMAAKCGHLNIVKFLHTFRTEGCTARAMDGAAENGHLHILEWLSTHRNEGCTDNAMGIAALNGHLQVVQWFHNNGFESGNFAMIFAIQNDHLHIVEWLHLYTTEYCCYTSISDSVPTEKALELLEWLCVNRSDFDPEYLLLQAIEANHVSMIELFVDRFGLPWITEMTNEAKSHGHLNLIEWIEAKSPGVTVTTNQTQVQEPVTAGDLAILQRLFEVMGLEMSLEVTPAE
ncbi:hypothetical protein AC1031_004236 [Aphanomyces cochlioides]|nr:hypothetical protein AC1031_004236 [Aphanomyces cochlioides]